MSTSDYEQDPGLVARLASELPLDDRSGPAPRITRDRAASMVEQALASMPLAATVDAPQVSAGRGWLHTAAMAAGALLMLTGGAALARYAYQQWNEPAPKSGAAQTAVPVEAIPVALPSPAPLQPPAEAIAPGAPEPEAALEPEITRAGKTQEALAPDDLLQKANRLRSLGQFGEAAATYSQVYERDARSLSAYVAQVAAASIELEHLAHPARAKKLYERALRAHPGGALDLEARQGLALSLRDLGDNAGETTALHALIEHHPKSPAAKRAELRLRELVGE